MAVNPYGFDKIRADEPMGDRHKPAIPEIP